MHEDTVEAVEPPIVTVNTKSDQRIVDNVKTPISMLQEYCAQEGTSAKFEVISVAGAVHAPTFEYSVKVKDMSASSFGKSKRKAKHAAAKALLDVIMSNEKERMKLLSSGKHENQIENTDDLISTYDDGIAGNPVGELQELCMKRRWPPPTYQMVSENGLPHEKYFSMTCTVGKVMHTGSGKSKKLAKRQAANKMIQEVDRVSTEKNGNDLLEELERKLCLKDVKIPAINTEESHRVRNFHNELKNSPGATLKSIQTTDLEPDQNAVNLLDKIAKENNFSVVFVDIEHKNFNQKYQCIVQLATQPVAVCYGVGDTRIDAQAAAAVDALFYLHVMTKP